ncbi:MAG: diphthine--ammonia ligase [Thermoplasmata archaeon]|nr:MAG: diphthine--ammonia ligase [Thermoplasmata archaeon]
MKEKVIVSWGGGKDSALALSEIQKNKNLEIAALLTTLSDDYDRISMHGVRRILLEQQAGSLGLPLEKVFIPKDVTNEEYESKMKDVLKRYQKEGVSSVGFGDIFLEDIRRYREDKLSKIGMKGIFPLWKKNTTDLAQEFIDSGFKAIITCIDSNFLDGEFTGRTFDKRFLSDLPSPVDPCGENGEFHSFVYDGPIFQKKIHYNKGEVVLRDNRFYFCDLIPLEKDTP